MNLTEEQKRRLGEAADIVFDVYDEYEREADAEHDEEMITALRSAKDELQSMSDGEYDELSD